MKIKIVLLIISLTIIAGCQREPMIKLSEENQARLEIQRNERTSEKTERESETKDTDSSEDNQSDQTQAVDSNSTTQETTSTESDTIAMIDTTNWLIATNSPELSINDFLPSQAYQFKEFNDGQVTQLVYPTFINNDYSLMQVATIESNQQSIEIYNWGSVQLIRLDVLSDNPFMNHLEQVAFNSTGENNELILQAPLQVGTTWERSEGVTSEITQLYSQVELASHNFANVLEVTSNRPDGTLVEYFAQGQGLIATVEDNKANILVGNYPDNRIIVDIPVYLPVRTDGGEQLQQSMKEFRWQTNGSFAGAFDDLLRRMDVIDDSVKVQDITYDDTTVYIDFSPGIVSVLNSYDSSEAGIIQSLVETLGEFFGRSQVRITVNGNGMLPQEIEYPANGIYYVNQTTENVEATTVNPE